jgi:hypothetical protein
MSKKHYIPYDPLAAPNALLESPILAVTPALRKVTERKLGYIYEPDKLALSYSRRKTLNRCTRLFQLREIKQRKSRSPSIDTAFGSAFGAGVQELFASGSVERATIAAFANWDYPEFEDLYGKKHAKSFWICVESIQIFASQFFPSIHSEYQLADLDGKSGVELFVYLRIGDSFNYQIHIDLILQNRETKALCVVEIKTSGMDAMESDWGNSSQTLGYYVVLETLSRRLGLDVEPCVYYICFNPSKLLDASSAHGIQIFPYVKTPHANMEFVQELMHDIRRINDCVEHDFFPKQGGACTTYRRPCEFYGSCDMMLNEPAQVGNQYESLTLDDADFILDLEDILSDVEKNVLTSN